MHKHISMLTWQAGKQAAHMLQGSLGVLNATRALQSVVLQRYVLICVHDVEATASKVHFLACNALHTT